MSSAEDVVDDGLPKKPVWQLAGRFGSLTSADSALRDQLYQEMENKLKLCANPTYDCSIPRVDGFDYCMRHILRESRGVFRQCSYIYANGRKCLHAVMAGDGVFKDKVPLTTLCFEHSRQEQLKKTRATYGKLRNSETNDVLLNNLVHHIKIDKTSQHDDNHSETNTTNNDEPSMDHDRQQHGHRPGDRDQDQDQDIDVEAELDGNFYAYAAANRLEQTMQRSGTKIRALDVASDSSDDDDMHDKRKSCGMWLDFDGSSDESIDGDDEYDNCLDHANIYTQEEAMRISIDKMKQLRNNYQCALNGLQYKLRDGRATYLRELRKERETNCSIHDQVKKWPNERHMYRKLKVFGGYHRRHGTSAVLYKKGKDKRTPSSGSYVQKAPIFPKCMFTEGGVKCGERSFPCSRHCQKHILEDKKQSLFRQCNVERSNVVCHEPVPCIGENNNCLLHFAIPLKQQYSQKKNDSETDDDVENTELKAFEENKCNKVIVLSNMQGLPQPVTNRPPSLTSETLTAPETKTNTTVNAIAVATGVKESTKAVRKSRKPLVPTKNATKVKALMEKGLAKPMSHEIKRHVSHEVNDDDDYDEWSSVVTPASTEPIATVARKQVKASTRTPISLASFLSDEQTHSTPTESSSHDDKAAATEIINNNLMKRGVVVTSVQKNDKPNELTTLEDIIQAKEREVNIISQVQIRPPVATTIQPIQQQQQQQQSLQLVQKQEIIQQQMQKQQVHQQQPQIFQIQAQKNPPFIVKSVQSTDGTKIMTSSSSSTLTSTAPPSTTTTTTPKILMIPLQKPQQLQSHQDLQLKFQPKLPQAIQILPRTKIITEQPVLQQQQPQQPVKLFGGSLVMQRKIPTQSVQFMSGGRLFTAKPAGLPETVQGITNIPQQLRFPGLPKSTSVTINKKVIRPAELTTPTTKPAATTIVKVTKPITMSAGRGGIGGITTTTATRTPAPAVVTSTMPRVVIKPFVMQPKLAQQPTIPLPPKSKPITIHKLGAVTVSPANMIRTSNTTIKELQQFRQQQKLPIQIGRTGPNVSQQLNNLRLNSNLQIHKIIPPSSQLHQPQLKQPQKQQQQQLQNKASVRQAAPLESSLIRNITIISSATPTPSSSKSTTTRVNNSNISSPTPSSSLSTSKTTTTTRARHQQLQQQPDKRKVKQKAQLQMGHR